MTNKQRNRIKGFFNSYYQHLSYHYFAAKDDIEDIQDWYMGNHAIPNGVLGFKTHITNARHIHLLVFCDDGRRLSILNSEYNWIL